MNNNEFKKFIFITEMENDMQDAITGNKDIMKKRLGKDCRYYKENKERL